MLSLDAGQALEEPKAAVAEAKIDTQSLEYQKMQLQQAAEANVPAHIFRAYDIRGKAHTEISTTLAHQIGLAIGSEARTRGEQSIVVGRVHARLSSADLQKALVSGLQESGCDVVDVGQVPSPVLYYVLRGLDLHHDLANQHSWFVVHLYAITGRFFEPKQLTLLEYLWSCKLS
jgi:hypothetical protein